jgi:hypothetical protein
VFIARLFLDGVAAIKFLMQGGFSDFIAVIRAHFYFYAHFSLLRKKRSRLQQKNVSGIYNGNIAFDHYLWRKKRYSDLSTNQFS